MISESGRALPGGSTALLDVNDAPFSAARDALFFLLQAAREHDVRVLRRLGQEEIDHAEKLQLVQGLAGEVGVRQRHQRVEADGKQRLDLAAVDRHP